MRRRSGFGWGELITGICMILLGIFTFINPGGIFTGLAVIYGAIAVINGICDIIFYIKAERYTGFGPGVALVSGVLSVMTGVVLLAHPGVGSWIVSILFPIWFIAHCISRLSHLQIIRMAAGTFYYYFSMIISILGLILGFLMIFQPVFAFFTAGIIIGSYLIVSGVDCIVLACSRMGSRW